MILSLKNNKLEKLSLSTAGSPPKQGTSLSRSADENQNGKRNLVSKCSIAKYRLTHRFVWSDIMKLNLHEWLLRACKGLITIAAKKWAASTPIPWFFLGFARFEFLLYFSIEITIVKFVPTTVNSIQNETESFFKSTCGCLRVGNRATVCFTWYHAKRFFTKQRSICLAFFTDWA